MKREVKSFIHARSRTAKKDSETFKEFENKLFFSLKEIKNFDHLFSLNETNILEIGFGDGKNILHQAINNPEKNFYGLEVYQNGIASTLRQIKLHNLNNIFLIYGDARDFLNKLKKPILDYIFILFPDPWPKKKHWKRRLINKDFLFQAKNSLKNKGQIIIRTDWEDYDTDLAKAFKTYEVTQNYNLLGSLKPLKTKYENKAAQEGRELFTYISDLEN